MNLSPKCHFCKNETESGGSMTGADPFTHLIRCCKHCNSIQHFIYGTDTLLSYNFNPKSEKYNYWVNYDLRSKRLSIVRVDYDNVVGPSWDPQVDVTLSDHPTWLAPDFISEHRIQTLKVFS